MEFKAGMRVFIRHREDCENKPPTYTAGMGEEFGGTLNTVRRVHPVSGFIMLSDGNASFYNWHKDWLVPAEMDNV